LVEVAVVRDVGSRMRHKQAIEVTRLTLVSTASLRNGKTTQICCLSFRFPNPSEHSERALRLAENDCVSEKQKEKIAKRFYAAVATIAYRESLGVTEQQVTEMRRRILDFFTANADGDELADSFDTVIHYFSGLGYWRGYRAAKRHYAALSAVRRTPDGRQKVHRAIEGMLEEDIHMTADEICEQLDKMRLSASFDLKRNGKQKTIHIGAGRQFRWKDVSTESSLKKMVSRIRTRLRTELRAEVWMKQADRAFASEPTLLQQSLSNPPKQA
jgi:hypothetical protein